MKLFGFVGMVAMTVLVGCGTTGRPQIRVELNQAPKSVMLEPEDVRVTVEKMTSSLISDPGLHALLNQRQPRWQPVLDIMPIQNRSTMPIDSKMITDSIRTRLIHSRLFCFMDSSTSDVDLKFMDMQKQVGLTDRRLAIRPGQQAAAQMVLTGTLMEMSGMGGRDRYYKFSMQLKDLTSGLLVWSDEQEIRKVMR